MNILKIFKNTQKKGGKVRKTRKQPEWMLNRNKRIIKRIEEEIEKGVSPTIYHDEIAIEFGLSYTTIRNIEVSRYNTRYNK